ncbi:unnamed protein product [Rotaria sp. Silwood1]|nr:unnamed protein product [Rotaria sp. Silwood1]CAF0857893.1 unnamed protein product [Rotaria sp. Silwood1]CAF3354786.1 unnamed protein product [Rotaria sp. Silwood1]CAF3378474.1 unnamed protein product [Rotaria sp. Silwood1]CAF3386445.1 unnamed protein product [Rotaria sp. Silwood1]
MIPDDIDGDHSKEYSVVATKRHKPCLIFRGYRYVQDKIQNRTIYWRCEDRTHCNGRAHQLVGNGSLPILTIKHNHQPIVDDTIINESMTVDGQRRQKRRQNLKTSYYQQNEGDDLLLSSTSSTMTSPIKIENHQNRQQHLQQQQHGAMVKNLHLSEVITTAAATNTHHYNGIGLHRHSIVDPIEMTKLLSNITTTTTTPSNPTTKTIPTSSNMDYSSRLNHFSWEEIEGRYLPVIFRNENDCLQRYTSKMYVENTLFQSESWQRYAILARSLPPLISFPYTENELKLFRLIVEWHLASFHFKTILPSDCLIRFEDLLDFYGALRKLRDSVTTAAAVTTTTFNRPLPPPPPPAPVPMAPPKPRVLPSSSSSASSSSNSLAQSFELPTMTGNSSIKQSHTHHRHSSSTKIYPPTVHHSHSSHYLLQQNADLLASFSNPSSQTFNFNTVTPKSNVPLLQSTSNQWNENLSKTNDKIHPPLPVPRPPIPMNNTPRQEPIIRDKQLLSQKLPHQSIDNHNLSRETKESGWVQINNVFVPYIVKLKLRESELEKCSTRQPPPQLQREFYVPYEILIKCHIFSDNEFAFKKFLIKATQQDFDIFNNLISNINIFDEKVPEKTLLVNLYHVMIGLQRILYVKLLTTKQPRTQVNKYHSEVLTHKGGTLLMHENKLVPYILQNNRFYVPLVYAFHSLPHIVSQAKRGARAPRQYEIDYLNLLFLYFSIDSLPLTSDTLLVDAFSIKSPDLQPPIHFRTLAEHQQYERNKLLNTITRITQTNNNNNKLSSNKLQQQSTIKSSILTNTSTHKSNKCPPANVVVNPLIHHPSFYGLSSTISPIKQATTTATTAPLPALPASSSNSVVVNPLLLPSTNDLESTTKKSSKQTQMKTIKYDNRLLNVIIKSSDQSINDSKISIKHIFEQFLFNINYDKFIQWCQTNLLLPLIKLDDEEKKFLNNNNNNNNNDDYYVDYRHLDRCIELLNDLKRGTISMTLLPSSNTESQQQQQQQTASIKSQLAGAKKRKTTIPTTRHIPPPLQSSSPSSSISTRNESSNPVSNDNGYLSPELPLNDEQPVSSTIENSIINNDTNDEDDIMPVVDTVEEEQPIQESNQLDMNTSLLIIDSNECDDGKIQLDDTLPSCSSGYESAAPLTNVDINMVHNPSSDDDETNSTTRSREHSSSCQSEQSHAPILSTVSTNITLNINEQEKNDLTPVITNQKSNIRQRDKHGKFRARSRSPTPRNIKKKRSVDDDLSSTNTITSDQIEHHLRTLLMPTNEQRRTRTRPIKTPTRLVEEIATNNSIKTTEPDMNTLDVLSTSSSTTTTDSINKTNSNESMINHQPCTYNVTISNKPNKLGLTIKKVIQR